VQMPGMRMRSSTLASCTPLRSVASSTVKRWRGIAKRRLTLRDIFVSVRRVVLWLRDVRVFADSRRTAAAAVMYMPVAA